MVFLFFIFNQNALFWVNLLKQVKIIILSSNSAPTIIRICTIQLWCLHFLFLITNTVFGQMWSQKSKLSVSAQIWHVDYFEYVEQWCSLVSFSIRNAIFEQLSSKKVKIISLSWNSVPTIIPICRIQWWCSFFLFLIKVPFLANFGPKNENYQFDLKFFT